MTILYIAYIIGSLEQIINQLNLWSVLMTASYLLNVLSSVISGCLDFRLLVAN